MENTEILRQPASYRDPDGYMFNYDKTLYRYIDSGYAEHYDHLLSSGLYETLVQRHLLIPHQELNPDEFPAKLSSKPYKILKPELIETITYPHEWSFNQLRACAIATLEIQLIAMQHGMTLKDAPTFNMQMYRGKPVLLDTLSFLKREANTPWVALGQFYRHFIWPLLAMSNLDVNLNKLFILYPDGVNIDTIRPMFGLGSWFKLSTLIHIHLHAIVANRSKKKPADLTGNKAQIKDKQLQMLLDGIKRMLSSLKIKQKTVWDDYYQNTNYQDDAFKIKEQFVKEFISDNTARPLIDFGANDGHFSRLAYKSCHPIYALDIDAMAVNQHFENLTPELRTSIHPIIVDLTNPSPGIGWENIERSSLINRLPNNSNGLALALTHHLHITHNINFLMQASFFKDHCENLMIEFIQREDSQVLKLLKNRYDDPKDYNQKDFESAFGQYFELKQVKAIEGTKRFLYTFKRLPL